jgi:xanthine/CO dehydrogenase XdhC/CoxF family maturation factor
MLQELTGEGLEITDGSLSTLHNPVGLDIGADSPEQIALAILSEIQAVLAGHAGGHLREKNAAIHTPRTADAQPARPGLNREGALCAALAS